MSADLHRVLGCSQLVGQIDTLPRHEEVEKGAVNQKHDRDCLRRKQEWGLDYLCTCRMTDEQVFDAGGRDERGDTGDLSLRYGPIRATLHVPEDLDWQWSILAEDGEPDSEFGIKWTD